MLYKVHVMKKREAGNNWWSKSLLFSGIYVVRTSVWMTSYSQIEIEYVKYCRVR